MVAPWIIAVGLVLIGCRDEPLPDELDAAAPDIPASDTGPPDILLITIDTLRADRIGAYGDTQARTPVIDNLAATVP